MYNQVRRRTLGMLRAKCSKIKGDAWGKVVRIFRESFPRKKSEPDLEEVCWVAGQQTTGDLTKLSTTLSGYNMPTR